jgi:hypothetical protein
MQSLTEGPFGFPLPDAAAKVVANWIKRLPRSADYAYRHTLITRGLTELDTSQRSDVSWISTEAPDRAGEVVLSHGMDDSQFRLNPVVTLGHDYRLPPVGRSTWRRLTQQGGLVGIKAHTHYPVRPSDWPTETPWLPDQVFALVQAGLLRGKSIGFLPLRVHTPSAEERRRHGWPDDVHRVVDEWLLLEYSCVCLPANQHALVEIVSKGQLPLSAPLRSALGLERTDLWTRRLADHLNQLGLAERVADCVATTLDRVRGRI